MSLTNEWHEPELLLKTKPVICEAIGFLISESQLDYKLATMISNDEIGSCHVIIKSAVISVTEYPKKSK